MADEKTVPVSSDEYEPILPPGWTEEDDLFDPKSWSGEVPEADAPKENADLSFEELFAALADDPSTTGEDDGVNADPEKPADDQSSTTGSEPTQGTTGNKLKFRARYNHQDQDVELDEADLPDLYQKAQYVDNARQQIASLSTTSDKAERLAKLMGYDSAAEMLDEAEKNFTQSEVDKLVDKGYDEADARELLESRQSKKLADTTPSAGGEDTTVSPRQAEMKADVAAFFEAHPDLRNVKVPDEVFQATLNGGHFNVEYQKYLDKQAAAETERLRKENRIYKQNADAAAKAPVRGVKGGGNAAAKPQSEFERLFIQGFNSDY